MLLVAALLPVLHLAGAAAIGHRAAAAALPQAAALLPAAAASGQEGGPLLHRGAPNAGSIALPGLPATASSKCRWLSAMLPLSQAWMLAGIQGLQRVSTAPPTASSPRTSSTDQRGPKAPEMRKRSRLTTAPPPLCELHQGACAAADGPSGVGYRGGGYMHFRPATLTLVLLSDAQRRTIGGLDINASGNVHERQHVATLVCRRAAALGSSLASWALAAMAAARIWRASGSSPSRSRTASCCIYRRKIRRSAAVSTGAKPALRWACSRAAAREV